MFSRLRSNPIGAVIIRYLLCFPYKAKPGEVPRAPFARS
jgi:hypothetical protein